MTNNNAVLSSYPEKTWAAELWIVKPIPLINSLALKLCVSLHAHIVAQINSKVEILFLKNSDGAIANKTHYAILSTKKTESALCLVNP